MSLSRFTPLWHSSSAAFLVVAALMPMRHACGMSSPNQEVDGTAWR
jgi:hypothetical protein